MSSKEPPSSDTNPSAGQFGLLYCLLFAYPVLSLVWRHSYPLFSLEIGSIMGVLAVISVLLAVVASRVQISVAGVLTAFAILPVILIQFNIPLKGYLIAVPVTLLVTILTGRNIFKLGFPVVIALIAGAWIDSKDGTWDAREAFVVSEQNQHMPPVVHIILDGFTGIGGLPPYPASKKMADEIAGLFSNFGFRLFPYAFSRLTNTADSMDAALNFYNYGYHEGGYVEFNLEHNILQRNAYFKALEEAGYQFNIYQTSYLDFCHTLDANSVRCWEYPQPNVRSLRMVDGAVIRARILATVLLHQSDILKAGLPYIGQAFVGGLSVYDLGVFKQFLSDYRQGPGGRTFFIHALVPHEPFVYSHDCTVDYDLPSLLRHPSSQEENNPGDQAFELKILPYFEQAECALFSLRHVFDEMKKSGFFDRSIIVVHSDHGAFIHLETPQQTNRAAYSILYAIKFPHGEFQVDNRNLPLNYLMKGTSGAIIDYSQGRAGNIGFLDNPPEQVLAKRPFIDVTGKNGSFSQEELFGEQ